MGILLRLKTHTAGRKSVEDAAKRAIQSQREDIAQDIRTAPPQSEQLAPITEISPVIP
jgi:hypothetical protein